MNLSFKIGVYNDEGRGAEYGAAWLPGTILLPGTTYDNFNCLLGFIFSVNYLTEPVHAIGYLADQIYHFRACKVHHDDGW